VEANNVGTECDLAMGAEAGPEIRADN